MDEVLVQSAEVEKEIDSGENNHETKPGVAEPLWLSVSESAKICGVNNKTIRRAIQSKTIKYKVINNRYFIEFGSMIAYLNETKKLQNKLNQLGVGQYVERWRRSR